MSLENHYLIPDKYLHLDSIITSIGMGKYQWQLFILCGMGYISDSMWFSSLSAILPKVRAEFNIPYSTAALGTTSTLVGMIIGSLVFGSFAAVHGRKTAFTITFIISTVSGLLAAFSLNFISLCVCLCALGVGIGGNIPVDSSLFLEFMPSDKKYLLTFLTLFWSISSVISTGLAWIFIPRFSCTLENCSSSDNRGWRYFLFTLSALSMVMLGFRFFQAKFHETPRFLISKKRYSDAVIVLLDLAKDNNKSINIEADEFDDSRFITDPECEQVSNYYSQVRELFGKQMLLTTILLCLVWISVSIGLGMFWSFLPVFLANNGVTSLSVNETYRNYFFVTLFGVPGTIVASYMVDSIFGRRGLMAISTLGSAGCFYLYTILLTSNGQLIASCVAQFLGNIMWGVLYSYSAEVFPTDIRPIGFGLVSAFGRLGGAIAPIITGILFEKSSSLSLYVSSAILSITGIIMLCLPIETRGKIVK